MSRDWHVYCVDCGVTHAFDDANHQDDLMLLLCKHADTLAILSEFMVEALEELVSLRTPWGDIDCVWFRAHLGHNLRPIDEYGQVLGVCHLRIQCGACGNHDQRCVLESGHEEPCRGRSTPGEEP